MHYCIDSCIPILNENCNIFVIYTVFFTRLFSTFENDDFFMVTAPTVVQHIRLLCNAQTNNYATISISIYFYSNCQRDGT